uniref:Uncharacterized protein n=1 Tax=Heliothis virescens TaxID=7102 RepID=A0A2A4IV50_HELVI
MGMVICVFHSGGTEPELRQKLAKSRKYWRHFSLALERKEYVNPSNPGAESWTWDNTVANSAMTKGADLRVGLPSFKTHRSSSSRMSTRPWPNGSQWLEPHLKWWQLKSPITNFGPGISLRIFLIVGKLSRRGWDI